MKRSSSLVTIAFGVVLSALHAGAEDINDIDSLVAALNDDGGLWQNGLMTPVRLPKNAKIQAIVKGALELQPEDSPLNEQYRILEERNVTINERPFVAVLMDYKHTTAILLCEYQFKERWWQRFYQFPKQEEKKQNKAEEPTPNPPSD